VRFEILTAASLKFRVPWDVAPCSHVKVDRRFRDAYFLHDGDEATLMMKAVLRNITVFYYRLFRQYSVWLRAGQPGHGGSIPGRGKGFFLYTLCPDRLWVPPSLLYNGYRGSFPRG
jgi:hypothetical protein